MYKGTKKRGKDIFRDSEKYSKKELPQRELSWHDTMATTTTTKYSTFINTLAGKDLCTLRLKIKHFLKPSKWLWSTACEQSACQPHLLKAGHMPRILLRAWHAQSHLRFMNVHPYLLGKTGIIIIILIFQVEIQLGLTYSQQERATDTCLLPLELWLSKYAEGAQRRGGPAVLPVLPQLHFLLASRSIFYLPYPFLPKQQKIRGCKNYSTSILPPNLS